VAPACQRLLWEESRSMSCRGEPRHPTVGPNAGSPLNSPSMGCGSQMANTPYNQKYPTAEEAAIAAMQDSNPSSIRQGREMGGWIKQNSDGTFTPRLPVTGSKDGLSNMPGKNADDVAWWHTHGAPDPGYDNENFSGATGDKGYSTANNAVGYLATPSGTIKKYDPSTGTVSTLPQTTPIK
jgi:hypothetical protein